MNPRGSKIIYNVLFAEEEKKEEHLSVVRGRDPELSNQRNECLIDRFFYISHKKKMWYHLAVAEVAPHFFLSTFHAGKLILSHREQLSLLRRKWKDEPIEKIQKHFASKWPHLSWN